MTLEAVPQHYQDEGEILKPVPVEIEIAEPKRYAEDLARLYSQESAIEHLMGIAPPNPPDGIDVYRYRERHPNLDILIATPEEIERYFTERPNIITLIAKDENGNVVGTRSILRPGIGMLATTTEKSVVSESVRGRKIGRKLVKAADSLAFSRKGFVVNEIRAGVILGVENAHIMEHILMSEGYRRTYATEKTCVSWDLESGMFVERNVQQYALHRDPLRNREHWESELEKNLPKGYVSASMTHGSK